MEPPANIRDCLRVRQAAQWLGVSEDTVRGWILRGELAPVYDVGTPDAPRYRIPRETVLARFRRVEAVKSG